MHTAAARTSDWTILALIRWGSEYLNDRGFEDARLNIELLLSHILHLKRINLYTNFDYLLTPAELAGFKAALQRRLNHEPLQYIMGETEFMGIPLFVNSSVLIPRPETEELVERAVDWARRRAMPEVRVLDIGTGSGNIPVAMERFLPNAYITSIDVSREALDVAARNVKRHDCSRIELQHLDVFGVIFEDRSFDMVIANPPYVSSAEFQLLQPEVKDFEPASATTDHADGLRIICRICDVAVKKLVPGGALFIEVAHNQGDEARRIATGAGLADVGISRDLSGHDRILQGSRAT